MKLSKTGMVFALITALGLGLGTSEVPAESGAEQNEEEEKKEGNDGVDARAALDRANQLAGGGALTRSVPHFEKAIRAGYREHPAAHFNLAGVLKAKENWSRALFHYQAYLRLGKDANTKSKAERGIESVKARIWNEKIATLNVEVEPTAGATILVDDFPVETNRNLEGFELVAGKYEVGVDVEDHKPEKKRVELGHGESKTVRFEPTKRTFFGTLRIEASEENADVSLKPKSLDAPNAPDEPIHTTTPVEESIRLATGKWRLELKKKGFHKWVRHVDIRRDKAKTVNVEMSKQLPEEIR